MAEVSTGLARVEERLANSGRDGDKLSERVAVLEDRVGVVESTVVSLSGRQKAVIGLLILLGGALGGSAGQLVRAALGG